MNIDNTPRQFNNLKFLEKHNHHHSVGVNSTDARVCKDIIDHMNIQPGAVVLEPCAGYGEFMYYLNEVGADLDVVEINKHAHSSQPPFATNSYNSDFMTVDLPRKYDHIIVNPPWRGVDTNGKRLYTSIIEKCLDCLLLGGTIAIQLHPFMNRRNDLLELSRKLDEFETLHTLSYGKSFDVSIYKKR